MGRAPFRSLLLSALAGASAWISIGTMAVATSASSQRLVALPPLWWLPAAMSAAVVAAWAIRLPVSRAWPLALSALLWLPYLPVPVPAAFLAWEGPIEWGVWVAVAAGVIFGAPVGWRGRVAQAASSPRHAPWMAAVLAAACYAGGWSGLSTALPGGDEPHYLIITQSVLLDHDLKIENNHRRGDNLAYFNRLVKPDYLTRGTDGEIYSVHPLGIAFLVLPAFAVAGYLGAVATIMAATALGSALAWRVAWMLTASAGGAWAGWAAVFLTTPYFFHGFTIYPDGVGGLLTIAAAWLLVALDGGRSVSRRQIAAVGAALAALPWMHTRFAMLAGALGAVLVARLMARADRASSVSALLAVPVVSAAAWFGHFWMIWSTLNPASPYGSYTNSSLAYLPSGAMGLVFDQQFGLVANAPVYAVAVLGLVALARQRPRLAIELVLVSFPYVAATASYAMWWGGVSAPARFLAALMPLAVLPVAWWWRARPEAGWRALTLALLLLSGMLVIARVSVDYGTMVFNARDGYDLLLDWAAKGADLPRAFPSFHRDALGAATIDVAIWGLAGLLLAGVARVISARPQQSAGAVWTVTVAAAAALSMLAATTVWTWQGAGGATPGRSQFAFLQHWSPARRPTTVLLPRVRSLTGSEMLRRIEVASASRVAPRPDNPTVFRASWVPAGEYDLVTEGQGTLGGELFVRVGKTDLDTERWRLDGRQPGFSGFRLVLPVGVHSVTIQGDPEARASISALRLRLFALRGETGRPRGGNPSGLPSPRAARFGDTRVFMLDEQAYLEPGGFWTRGQAVTSVVFDRAPHEDPAPLTVWLRSGAVATDVEVSMGEWRARVALGPEQRKAVQLPPRPASGAWPVRIRTASMFRPRDYAPDSGDDRPLGVWVEVR